MVTDGNVLQLKWAYLRKREPKLRFAKSLPFLTIKRIGITVFCRLKGVGCSNADWAKLDSFQLKSSNLQQISSVFKTPCLLTPAPPAFKKPSDFLTAFFTAWQAIPRTAGGLARCKTTAKQPLKAVPPEWNEGGLLCYDLDIAENLTAFFTAWQASSANSGWIGKM